MSAGLPVSPVMYAKCVAHRRYVVDVSLTKSQVLRDMTPQHWAQHSEWFSSPVLALQESQSFRA